MARRNNPLENNRTRMRRLHGSGLTDIEIANEMGVTRSAVGLWRKRHGLPRNSRKGRTYASWHYRAMLLHQGGFAVEAISERLGKQYRTVRDTLRRKKSAQ